MKNASNAWSEVLDTVAEIISQIDKLPTDFTSEKQTDILLAQCGMCLGSIQATLIGIGNMVNEIRGCVVEYANPEADSISSGGRCTCKGHGEKLN